MDIEAFSDDAFDAVAWINATFKPPATGSTASSPTKEAAVSAMVSKLQLYVQQLNSALEDTSQQVLAGMPRIMRDAQNLQTEAQSLRSAMSAVQSDIAQVQQETGACMEHLERLDGLQSKLRVAKQGLQESDGWGKLTAELEDLLEQSNLLQAQAKLAALHKSLGAQAGLAGQLEREAQVEDFKNRIEALASPGVVDAFSSADVEKARGLVRTFEIMQRTEQLWQYYRTVQRQQLQQFWTELLDLSSASGGGGTFLRDFYEHLAGNWRGQLSWCRQVFGEEAGEARGAEAQPTLVLCELLETMQPSREAAVAACLKRSADRLAVLQAVSAANLWLVAALQKHAAAAGEGGGAEGELVAAADEGGRELAVPRLCEVICDWFQPFVAQLATIEQTQLATRLAELPLSHATSAETVRSLGAANAKLIGWLREARQRCATITQDCGLPALVIVLGSGLKQFGEKYKKAQQQLHASRSIEQNWSVLQSCIALLQHLGDFYQQLVELEREIADSVLAKAKTVLRQERALRSGALQAYAIVGNRERSEFAALAAATKDAEQEAAGGSVFRAARDQIISVCEYVHDTTLAAVFAPVETQMQGVATAEALRSTQGGDLPAYSFAPQEFITEVGQYLLTLPQHLEPLLLRPSTALRVALELCDVRYGSGAAAVAGQQQQQQPPSADGQLASADVLLSLLVDETCAMYEEQIARIAGLSAAGAKQLATDIEYLGSVLEELGQGLGVRLQQTVQLMRASPETYLACSAGCDPKLVTRIRQMRNIVSME